MSKVIQKKHNAAARRAHRTRTRVKNAGGRPRLSIFRSAKHIYAQIIDDAAGKTLASASDVKMDTKGKKPVEVAALVGEAIAKAAKDANVSTVVFDRGSYKYHGRVKALADAARNGGLEF